MENVLTIQYDIFQFIYLRELDLEKINRGTVVELANHKALKKVGPARIFLPYKEKNSLILYLVGL